MDREPSPEEAAMLAEVLESLLSGLSPRDREIVRYALQGVPMSEIATNVKRSEDAVCASLSVSRSR